VFSQLDAKIEDDDDDDAGAEGGGSSGLPILGSGLATNRLWVLLHQ